MRSFSRIHWNLRKSREEETHYRLEQGLSVQTGRMRDFKYRALANAPLPDWGWESKDFRTEYLRPVAEAFRWNLVRSCTVAKFPAWMALEAIRERLWLDYATTKFGREIDPDLSQALLSTSSESVAAEFNRLVEEYCNLSDEQTSKLLGDVGVEYVEYRLRIANQQSSKIGIDALLSTIVIESWVIFENLASDLWVVAVDKGPSELRARLLGSREVLKPDNNISQKDLHDLDYDPQSHFGSALREIGRVSFSTLEYTKRFYRIAFNHDFDKMFNRVEGGYIVALSAFRNALLHNAGRADKRFVNRVAMFPEFRAVKPDERLILNGELVKRFRDAARLLGQQLIQFVDQILTP